MKHIFSHLLDAADCEELALLHLSAKAFPEAGVVDVAVEAASTEGATTSNNIVFEMASDAETSVTKSCRCSD